MEINRIYNEDCLRTMKRMGDKSVDLVLTDPPYGLGIGSMGFTNSTRGGVARRNDYKGEADWDVSTPGIEVFEEIVRISKNQIIFGGNYFTDKLPVSSCWITWDKRVQDKYSNDFADCEYAWTSFDRPSRIIRYLWSGMLQGNMKNKEKRFHPTQKPVPVISRLLEMFSAENDLVYDPFMGSGTTAVACKKLSRDYIGSEISEDYCKVAEKRLEQKYLF